MDKLLDAITALVSVLSADKIRAIAARLRNCADKNRALPFLKSSVATPKAELCLDQLVASWQLTDVSASELGLMLLAASHAIEKSAHQEVELVWTGPTTSFVSTRRTEQVFLQLIENAKTSIFITSFVAYDISSIVDALNRATERGVRLFMLLESTQEFGGSLDIDVIARMRTLVPDAILLAWQNKTGEFADGKVHAKLIVADNESCFVTSANLTNHAMEKNMEAGILVHGGQIPDVLGQHLWSLVSTRIIASIQ